MSQVFDSKRGVSIDWYIEDSNRQWHETYFARQAVKDHQAKGSCALVWKVLEYMEEQKWLQKNDLILDFMCGIGSFLVVSALKGYNAVGIELEDVFVNDFYGYDTREAPEDDLFAGFKGHVQGVYEKFASVTKGMKNIGDIAVIRGDARNIETLLTEQIGDYFSGSEKVMTAVCSPPYGSRLWDEGQRFSSKDKRTWSELGANDSERKQYGLDSDNIGNDKIKVVTSPPYSSTTEIGGGLAAGRQDNYSDDNIGKSPIKVVTSPPYSRITEHSKGQINSMKGHDHGHRAFQYQDRGNVALLRESAYSREMLKVYKSLFKALGAGSYIALVTRNFIQQGKVVMLDELTIRLMNQAGFRYLETKRAVLPDISMFKYMNYEKYHEEKGLPMIDWEEVTFYTKPEPKETEPKPREFKQAMGRIEFDDWQLE